jgi:hypothetical protein
MTRRESEQGTDLVEKAAEACSSAEGFEPPMLLFQMVVKIVVGPVPSPGPHRRSEWRAGRRRGHRW